MGSTGPGRAIGALKVHGGSKGPGRAIGVLKVLAGPWGL